MFYPGDRVILVNKKAEGARDNRFLTTGMVGTILEEEEVIDTWVSVCWDDDVKGHTCSGHAPINHGWRVSETAITLYNDANDISIDEQELLSLL